MSFRRIGVVGFGLMGAGITEVAVRGGAEVVVIDANTDALDAGRERLAKSLARAVKAGKATQEEADASLARVSTSTDLTALADVEAVIEVIREDEETKHGLIRALEPIIRPDAVIITNTSSLSVTRLASVLSDPTRFVGLHFFNPVPQMPVVELIEPDGGAAEAAAKVDEFAREVLDKDVIHAVDRPGFVVNALLVPYIVSAIRMWGNKIASAEDIDRGMVGGCGMPMGPLALADLIGLDTLLQVTDALYAQTNDPALEAPAVFRELVDAGKFGRKTGAGIYSYS